MIKVTPEAARQIQISASQGNTENLALRIAATKNDDGSFHYGMGFDEDKDGDIAVTSEGVKIIVSAISADLLKDTTLDYVELEPGKSQFIFMNPNDPNYTPPSDN
ncbi:MAG: iron-sulfur cluster assembly accessory protein [Gammaproteobacteria bacterium]|nr:iron-sulfur cluster assembly accessory protein [Gammaproteobacteria bacterium]MCW8923737.1 iron-sulfur cluster assembly accessory protein [Gammaproteobacteria bacterium]